MERIRRVIRLGHRLSEAWVDAALITESPLEEGTNAFYVAVEVPAEVENNT